jgi:hypothetical protein
MSLDMREQDGVRANTRPAGGQKRRKRDRRQRIQRARPAPREADYQGAPQGFLKVLSFKAWCRLVGISEINGRRLAKAGKVKITQMSERRIGVREDHHREYLDSCLREVE